MKTLSHYWVCQIAGWALYCLFGIGVSLQYVQRLLPLLTGYALFFAYSIGMTDWFRQQIKRRRWLELPAAQRIPRLVGGSLLIGTLLAALVVVVDYGFQREWWAYSNFLWLWVSTTNAALVWTFLYVQSTTRRRAKEREVHLQLALRDAELRALESQINPHFLFNCLNSIRALVMIDPSKAQDMLTRLANVLRHTLRSDQEHTQSLSSEMEAVADYLALEGVRFEQRLRVHLTIEPAAAQCQVPPMLLHTLVENAVKHGIAHVAGEGDLFVRARCENSSVRIEVENTGTLAASPTQGEKLGLANTRERLKLLYGNRASLELHGANNRVVASVLIPVAEN